jgi:hypothetical protein
MDTAVQLDRRKQILMFTGVILPLLALSTEEGLAVTTVPKAVGALNGFARYAWASTSIVLTSTAAVPCVRTLRGCGQTRHPAYDAGIKDQSTEDQQKPLQRAALLKRPGFAPSSPIDGVRQICTSTMSSLATGYGGDGRALPQRNGDTTDGNRSRR